MRRRHWRWQAGTLPIRRGWGDQLKVGTRFDGRGLRPQKLQSRVSSAHNPLFLLKAGCRLKLAPLPEGISIFSETGAVPVCCRVSALSVPIFRVAAEEAGVVRAAGCHQVITVW
jgi:hypothetical protein